MLRRVRRGCGCTESLREALRGWLAVEECQRGLMDPVAWDYEITALCNGIHSKVGMGRGQIPNEDEPKPNWSLMLRSRRIEKNCLGGQGDSGAGEVMAWLGSSAASTHGPTSPLRNNGTGKTYSLDGYLHGHSSKQRTRYGAMAAGSARQPTQSDATRRVWQGRRTSFERTAKESMEQSWPSRWRRALNGLARSRPR